jgi:hypothetical protein
VLGLACEPRTDVRTPDSPSPTGVASAQATRHGESPTPGTERELGAPMVRLGHPAFGNATFVATSPDGALIAASLGMAGAEVEILDADARPLRKVWVDLDYAVRAVDFSTDGSTLLVSLTGARTEVKVVRVSDAKVLRTISLDKEDASGRFHRGPEARFLADGSFVACSGGRILHFPGEGEPRAVGSAPQGAFLSTSTDRAWLLVATPDAVSARKALRPAQEVWRRERTTKVAEAFIDEDGAALFDDAGNLFLRSAKRSESGLGEGRPVGLSRDVAVLHRAGQHELLDRKSQRRAMLRGARGFFAASGRTLFASSGADEVNGLTPVPVEEVLAGRATVFGAKPWKIGFSHAAHELLVLDREELVRWDTRERRVRARIPHEDEQRRGIFRTATEVFVLGDKGYRLVGDTLEEAGLVWAGNPKAVVRKDGSTVVCASDALQRCQGHFLFAPAQARFGKFAWGYLFPFSNGMGFMEGPSKESGSDLGVGKMTPHENALPLDETWLTDVDLWWAAPVEGGGLIVTKEGADPLKRKPFLRRVGDRGLGKPCALSLEPSRDAGIAVAPNGRTVAIPGFTVSEGSPALHLVDVETCEARTQALPAPALSVDVSPDGAEVAVGMDDRTVAVLTLR